MAASYSSKTSGYQRIYLLDQGDRISRAVANSSLPPVAKIHWHGAASWLQPKVNIEGRIQHRFRRGDNSLSMRATLTEMLRTKYSGYDVRYTDGSSSVRGVGIGIDGQNISACYSLPTECSVFSAEAAAIFVAVSVPSSRPILVLTDSASVISALQAENPTHPWIQGIIAGRPNGCTFAWIPGHCGIPGNDMADLLAGTGYQAPKYTMTVPLLDVKRWIRSTIWRHWSAVWAANTSAQLRRIKGSTSPWDDLPSLRDQRIISRLRTGHTRFAYNFGGGSFQQDCDICGLHNTVEHVICRCPKYDFPRQTYGISGSIRDVLADDPSALGALLCFLKDTGLYYNI